MLCVVSNQCALVTLSVRRIFFEIFDFKNAVTLKTGVRGPSNSLEMSTFDRAHMTSYWRSIVNMALLLVVSEIFSLRFFSLRFNGHFPGEPGLAGVYWSKGWWKWWWQLDRWSYKSYKQSSSQMITTYKPTSSFLQAGCPSCRPTNSVNALKRTFLKYSMSKNIATLKFRSRSIKVIESGTIR